MLLRGILLFTALIFWSGEASASLYCVIDFNGKRCHYPDVESCRKAAGPRGQCVLNRGKMIAPTGGAPYCLVEKWKTECIYHSRAGCDRQAVPRQASCIANPNLAASPKFDSLSQPGQNRGGGQSQWDRVNDQQWDRQQQQWNQQQKWGGESSGGRYLPSPGYDPRPGAR